MLDDEAGDYSGCDDDVPWSRESFETGDRVKWTAKAIRRNIPTKSRRNLRGRVTSVEVGDGTGLTFTVRVLWDGYKHPQSYAACFVTKSLEE